VFATTLNASHDASTSSLEELAKERSIDRAEAEAKYSEPVGFFPRVLRASSAWAASEYNKIDEMDDVNKDGRRP
jgi:hypothetical protein